MEIEQVIVADLNQLLVVHFEELEDVDDEWQNVADEEHLKEWSNMV